MTIPLPDPRSLSDEVREALRLRAVAARETGFSNDTVAAILGVRPQSVSRWFAPYQPGGAEALPGDPTRRAPAPPHPPRRGTRHPGAPGDGHPRRLRHRLGAVDATGRPSVDPAALRPAPAN